VAVYVLPAEVVLAVAAWLLVRGRRPAAWTAVGVLALPFLYTGLAATGYQLLG
jgi:threonine/homoserine/homoserine lactone efflux protein